MGAGFLNLLSSDTGLSFLWAGRLSDVPLMPGLLCLFLGGVVIPFVARKEEKSGSREASATKVGASGTLTLEQERMNTAVAAAAVAEPKAKARAATVRSRALIVGAGAVGRALAEKLETSRRYQVVGFVDDDSEMESTAGAEWPILGPRISAAALIRQYAIDEVFLAYAPTWQQELAEELARSNNAVRVQVVPSFYETMLRVQRIESIGDVAVVPMGNASFTQPYDRIKRVLDFAVSLIGLLVLFPLMLALSLFIKRTSPGPVLFTQERVGHRGKTFLLYKFRTMLQDAEERTGPVLSAGKNDDRLTPIGRWLRLLRLDELPQLINVIRGEMSLVGPRPERPCFVEQFAERNPVYSRRHEVLPGITGLAQIHGGYHTDARDKLRFDLFYVSHRSPTVDFSILCKTVVLTVFRPNGR